MQQNIRVECPKCSRPLQKFNGHIGYCSQHKWVSPAGLGFEAEASEQNRQDAVAEEKSRLEKARQEEEAKAQEIRAQHQSTVRKVIVIAAALALIAAAVALLVVRPSLNYSSATDKFIAGEYQTARNSYSALGSYKDSAARVLLCDAMIDLQEGRPEDAAARLDQLTSEGQGDIAKQLADALLPVVAEWKARGLTPQALLLLLEKADVIDPSGTLDIDKLTEEGHTALLDGTQLLTYTDDVNGDGNPDLIVLNPDYSVTAYRMAGEGNVRMAIDNDTASACEMVFGNRVKDTDADAAVACFSEAYRLLPNDKTRSALTSAYQLRSADFENAGNMEAAVADARSALETAGTADAFSYFYDLMFRNCKNGHSVAEAIEMWDAFSADSAAELTRFSAQSRWKEDAAQLHIARAAELASQKSEDCIAELRTAAEMGADVTGAVADAESYFEPGLSLARIRLMEIDLLGTDAAKEQEIRSDMADEIRTAISEWKSRGISPADVPALIHLADDQGIDLSMIHPGAAYEEAAVASAGIVSQYSFVDWDEDSYQELLTLDPSGNLSLYGTDEAWTVVSAIDTGLPGSSYTIADEKAPLILILSSEEDELLAVTGTSSKLSTLFRETGISRYKAEGSTVTFSRLLEGSIARYNDYVYEAVGTAGRPVRTGVDWQKNDYPAPADAAEAVQRYFEARVYDIPEEAALLTAEPSLSDIFTAEQLDALAVPDVPGTVDAASYLKQEGRELFEVAYVSGAQNVRTWISAEYAEGWKLTGAADTYGAGLSSDAIDCSVSLLSLNTETAGIISARRGRNTYRLLIPSAGRLSLSWQSGSKAVSRDSYSVAMLRGSLSGDQVFAYQLQPNPGRQQSKDMFVSAGVYYLTVEAKVSDAEEYHLMITYRAENHVELENNDTYASATAIELNTGYSGSLSSAKDVDYYSFTLDANSAVNVTFGIPGSGSKSAAHTLTVISAADGSKLATVAVPGNVQMSETGNLYLSSGTYLVQVSKGTAYTNDEYVLTVNSDRNGNMESEPNNTAETANPVPVNEDIQASIGREGDIDCFAFTLEGDAVIQPRFTFKPTDDSAKTYVLTITDAGRREMLKVNIGGKESTKVIAPVALTAGTYTVKIENPRFVRQDYTLCIVSVPTGSAEGEPNDTAALAADLFVGQPRTGVLTTDGDVDYFKLRFSAETQVTLKFSFAQTTNKSTAFVLTIEQNGKTQWTANIKGDSGGLEQVLKFPAGEYYIRVKPSSWQSSVYTIEIQ